MNYPNKNKIFEKKTNYSNRGMKLEDDINLSNEYYLVHDIAVIYKKPTPIAVKKVDYKNNIINEAYYKCPSTTDYNGIYKGKYIDFEAKETNNISFPLENIKQHQIEHLNRIVKHGGIGFIIVRFNKYNETYLLESKYIDVSTKSIKLDYFKNYGYLIKENYNPRLDYIKIVDVLEEKYEQEHKKQS